MFTQQLHLITLALVIGAGAAQGQGQITSGGSAALQPSLVSLRTTHDGLAAQFRRLAAAATGPTAQAADRQALARFVRHTIVPQLQSESFELITAFDSLVGGGYAVPATLFDLDAIGYLIKEIERTAGGGDRITFETRSYALSVALEGYFTKMQLLVLPVLNARLGGPALSTALTRLEARRTTR
jgi:hypothetical protein